MLIGPAAVFLIGTCLVLSCYSSLFTHLILPLERKVQEEAIIFLIPMISSLF